MHVSLVTCVGVVVDGTILRRRHRDAQQSHDEVDTSSNASETFDSTACEGSVPSPVTRSRRERAAEQEEELHYECKATGKPIHQVLFHAMDVLPFGFHSPSTIFSTVGRHTNHGLVTGVTPSGMICVRPYPSKQSGPLTTQYTRTRLFKRTMHNEKELDVSQPWLASVCQLSRSAAVHEETQRFLLAADSSYATTVASQHAHPVASLDNNNASTGMPMYGLLSCTPSPNSTSGAIKPVTPTRVSPKEGGGGARLVTSPLAVVSGAGPTSVRESTAAAATAVDQRFPSAPSVETFDLCDMALPPPLSRHRHTPPLKVGSRVVARRFGCDSVLHPATVLAVTYDVAYRLQYTADNGIDEGVLHNDVLLISESDAELCTVRDRVIVALQLQTTVTVIEAMGGGCYRGVLVHDPSQEVQFTTRNLVAVSPLLVDALYAPPQHVNLFRSLDPTYSGQVRWKNVRHAILHMEFFGKSLSFQTLGEIQRDLCILRRRIEPQMLHKVPVQEEEMFLSFNEFEFVLLRALNQL